MASMFIFMLVTFALITGFGIAITGKELLVHKLLPRAKGYYVVRFLSLVIIELLLLYQIFLLEVGYYGN